MCLARGTLVLGVKLTRRHLTSSTVCVAMHLCYQVSVMAALISVCYLYPFFVDRSAWCSICPS